MNSLFTLKSKMVLPNSQTFSLLISLESVSSLFSELFTKKEIKKKEKPTTKNSRNKNDWIEKITIIFSLISNNIAF